MNYRHAFHAGSFADCLKHALLLGLVDALAVKPTPYFVMDTHAGAGFYDLNSDEARRTSEAETGIKQLLRSQPPGLERYLGLVNELGPYPGSPLLIQAALREGDRLTCCELHQDDSRKLRDRFRRDPRVEVHQRSAWEALNALLPPREKRGLVFIDPPFEVEGEFESLLHGLRRGHHRFSNGIFAAWYPITIRGRSDLRTFRSDLASSSIADIITIELCLQPFLSHHRLSGCGLAVINPPYQFEQRAWAIASALLAGFGPVGSNGTVAVCRLSDE